MPAVLYGWFGGIIAEGNFVAELEGENMRVTVKNIEAMVVLYADYISELTGERPELQLTEGSSTYGRQFYLQHIIRDSTSNVVNLKPFWGSYDGGMGFTRREAWDALSHTNSTLANVIDFMNL